MTDECRATRRQRIWLAGALVAAGVGALAAVAFAVVWFSHAARGDGMVRFYERAFGVIVLGAWAVATAVGLCLALIGRRRNSEVVAAGAIMVILAALLMAGFSAKTTLDIHEADYSRKDTPRLLALLAGSDLDARKEASHALGERRAAEAVAPLCGILESVREDINLRLNAAMALGKICAPPRALKADLDRALASLTRALKDRDAYLPGCAAESLGKIGDVRSVQPLVEFMGDEARPLYARCDAAMALSRIGGPEARAALAKTQDAGTPQDLADAARRCLARMRRQERVPPPSRRPK